MSRQRQSGEQGNNKTRKQHETQSSQYPLIFSHETKKARRKSTEAGTSFSVGFRTLNQLIQQLRIHRGQGTLPCASQQHGAAVDNRRGCECQGQGNNIMHAKKSAAIAAVIALTGFSSPAPADTPYVAVWDHGFGDALDQSVTAVTTDPSSTVYTLVNLAGTVDFGCGPLTSAGSVDVALAKYDSGGACLWSKRFGDASSQSGVAARADATGIVIAATFSGSIDPGGGTPDVVLGSSDIVVARFDSSGAEVWNTKGGGTATDTATGLALDSAGNTLVIGSTAGTFAMGSVGLTSVGGDDGFVIQLNSTGNPQWLHAFSGAGEQQPHGVASDSSNNVIVAGLYAQSMDLGTGPLTSQGMNDIFLAKFDSAGNTVWAESFGAAGNDIGYAVAVDSANDIWMCGSYSGTVSFGGVTLTSHAASDNFVVRLDSAGHVLWAIDPYSGSGTGVNSVRARSRRSTWQRARLCRAFPFRQRHGVRRALCQRRPRIEPERCRGRRDPRRGRRPTRLFQRRQYPASQDFQRGHRSRRKNPIRRILLRQHRFWPWQLQQQRRRGRVRSRRGRRPDLYRWLRLKEMEKRFSIWRPLLSKFPTSRYAGLSDCRKSPASKISPAGKDARLTVRRVDDAHGGFHHQRRRDRIDIAAM